MQILAISGSLRARSSNTAMLLVAAALAPAHVEVELYGGLGDLPHFNPDLDGDTPPSVVAFRTQLRRADGVLISSPEYAHGVPGVLKNALDWVVASGEFMGKPVALLNASPNSTHAQASLAETLTVIMAEISADGSCAVQIPGNRTTEADMLANPAIAGPLRAAMAAFAAAIAAGKETGDSG